MNVFVTGGTGVLGTPAIRMLIERGHTVTGLAHSDDAVEKLERLGARAVRGDLFDPETLVRATEGMDAILHLATRIPPSSKMRSAAAWDENSRIRAEGTRNLVDAALANEVEVLVYPSVTFLYPDSGDAWVDATSAGVKPTFFLRSTLEAEAQVQRFAESGGRGVTLRLGWLYGPTSSHTLEALNYAKRGLAAVLAPDDAWHSSIWNEDASHAIVLAMEKAPSGIYDVVDDEPLREGELLQTMAQAVQKKRLRRLPRLLTGLATGSAMSEMGSRSQRVSNRRFKEATGWQPVVRSAREGWAQLAG